MTAPALDSRTAAEAATLLLAASTDGTVTYHGDEFTITRSLVLRDSTGFPWGVSLTVSDDTRGESINVTATVSATPVGAR